MAQSRIVELALSIASNTTKIDDFLSSHNLRKPSFEVDAPLRLEFPSEAAGVEAARLAAIEATKELHDLLTGPTDCLHNIIQNHNDILSLQAVSRFEIATTFPLDEEASFAAISKTCGLDEINLRRLLRHAMTNHIFKETQKGVVGHTAVSKILAENKLWSDFARSCTDEVWPAATQAVNALLKYPGSQEPTETGFNLAHHTSEALFEVLEKNPARAERFASSMTIFLTGKGFEPDHLAEHYPWDTNGVQRVVDVGGSHGSVSLHLAKKFPDLKFIVQDLSRVVSKMQAPPGLASRVEFMEYNFFTQQPVKNADVYLFRWIFHDWSDKYCKRILISLIPALKNGAKVIVNDFCLPESNTLSPSRERAVRLTDLTMMQLFNSRERELDDWKQLFHDVDSRFVFEGFIQPSGSHLAIIKFEWKNHG